LDLGPHAAFIWAAYAAAALVLAGLAAWLVLDGRRQQRLVHELEARGVRRRSSHKARAGAPPLDGEG
jgi:heme exporter protein D